MLEPELKTFNIRNIHTPHLYQFFAYLPAKNAWILLLQLIDLHLDLGSGYLWLGSANHSRSYRTGFLVAVKNFRHATVGHAQLP